jgi:large subunit ribosomal protein L24
MAGVAIKKNDEVQVISGKDRGKRGRVIHVLPDRGRVLVDGVARARKATRTQGKRSASGQQLQQGGIIDTELFVELSNVMLVCKNCGKATRIGHRIEDGVKARICKKCDSET